MSQQIISQRIGVNLPLDGSPVYSDSGSVQYTQPVPTVNGPLAFFQQEFPGNDYQFDDQYWPAPLYKFPQYQDSIFIKRWRFYSNAPSAFYFIRPTATSNYISFLWATNYPGFDWGTNAKRLERIFCLYEDTTAFGEWHDINMALPKSQELNSIPSGPSYGITIGTFFPSTKFHYRGIPADIHGSGVRVRIEVEIAHTLSDFNWKGNP